jgi:hypothetical protein
VSAAAGTPETVPGPAAATDATPRTSLVALRSDTGVALIAATAIASLVGFLDASVVNVAVPAIGRDLSASVSALQWVLTRPVSLRPIASRSCSARRSS